MKMKKTGKLKKVLSIALCALLAVCFIPVMPGSDVHAASERYVGEKITFGAVYDRYSLMFLELSTNSNESFYVYINNRLHDIGKNPLVYKEGNNYVSPIEIIPVSAGTLNYNFGVEWRGSDQRVTKVESKGKGSFNIKNFKGVIGNVEIIADGPFVSGGIFPQFTVPEGAHYEIKEVSFYAEMTDFYPGDKLLTYSDGSKLNLSVEIVPEKGYVFTGTSGGNFKPKLTDYEYVDSLVKLSYKGKTYKTKLNKTPDYTNMICAGGVEEQISKGSVYSVYVKNLDKPAEGAELDKEITITDFTDVTSVKYYVGGKEVSSVKEGDNVDIVIGIKLKNNNYFRDDAFTAWYNSDNNKICDGSIKLIDSQTAELRFSGIKAGIAPGYVRPEEPVEPIEPIEPIEPPVEPVEPPVEPVEPVEPMEQPEDPGNYKMPFNDVKKNAWYYDNVQAAHKMGLINGKKDNEYKPNDNMTFAEAVKLAVCMNILYNGGDPAKDIANGSDVWYSTYMKYALNNDIIAGDLSSIANKNITRAEYVEIFYNSLPKEAFAEKNTIPAGSIPDISTIKNSHQKAVYAFYRAGVLSGVDAKGNFKPAESIKRSEVASILIRMMDKNYRVGAPAELGK